MASEQMDQSLDEVLESRKLVTGMNDLNIGVPKFLKVPPLNSRDFINKSLGAFVAARNLKDAICSTSYASTSRNQNEGASRVERGSIKSGYIPLRQDVDPLCSSLQDLIETEVLPSGKGRGSKREEVRNMEEPGRIALRKDVDPCTTSLDDIIVHKKAVCPSGKWRGSKREEVSNMEEPGRIALRKDVDPCTTSLDDIIVPKKAVYPSGKERGSKRKDMEEPEMEPERRMAVQQRQYPNVTAFRAVGFLSAEGMIIEIVIGRLKDDSGDRSHLWRCVITSGKVQGISDSVRKVVAREMASNEFLIAISEAYKEVTIPNYTVMKEILIDPRLFHKLEKEAVQRALEISHEVMVKPLPPTIKGGRRNTYYKHICNYYVGKEKFTAENVIIEYAKLLAAKEAYFALTGKEPSPTVYYTGAECDPALEHNFNESEVFQHVARIDNDGRNYSLDAEEAKLETARREHSQYFKNKQAEEEKRRRHMAIQI